MSNNNSSNGSKSKNNNYWLTTMDQAVVRTPWVPFEHFQPSTILRPFPSPPPSIAPTASPLSSDSFCENTNGDGSTLPHRSKFESLTPPETWRQHAYQRPAILTERLSIERQNSEGRSSTRTTSTVSPTPRRPSRSALLTSWSPSQIGTDEFSPAPLCPVTISQVEYKNASAQSSGYSRMSISNLISPMPNSHIDSIYDHSNLYTAPPSYSHSATYQADPANKTQVVRYRPVATARASENDDVQNDNDYVETDTGTAQRRQVMENRRRREENMQLRPRKRSRIGVIDRSNAEDIASRPSSNLRNSKTCSNSPNGEKNTVSEADDTSPRLRQRKYRDENVKRESETSNPSVNLVKKKKSHESFLPKTSSKSFDAMTSKKEDEQTLDKQSEKTPTRIPSLRIKFAAGEREAKRRAAQLALVNETEPEISPKRRNRRRKEQHAEDRTSSSYDSTIPKLEEKHRKRSSLGELEKPADTNEDGSQITPRKRKRRNSEPICRISNLGMDSENQTILDAEDQPHDASERPPLHDKILGLNNLGLSCFMNADIQALFATDPIREYYLEKEFQLRRVFHSKAREFAQPPKINSTKINISTSARTTRSSVKAISATGEPKHIGNELGRIFRALRYDEAAGPTTNNGPVNTTHFRGAVVGTLKNFTVTEEQHDAQEFLHGLLGNMESHSTGNFIPSSNVVSQTFQGILDNRTTCLECGKYKENLEPFLDLSLDMPIEEATSEEVCEQEEITTVTPQSIEETEYHHSLEPETEKTTTPAVTQNDSPSNVPKKNTKPQQTVRLESCLDKFTSSETLSWSADAIVATDLRNASATPSGINTPSTSTTSAQNCCPDCQSVRGRSKALTIKSCPEYLILHLKRFSWRPGPKNNFQNGKMMKLKTRVSFPLTGFNLSRWMTHQDDPQSGNANTIYELYATVCHLGELAQCGHYVAYIKRAEQWYRISDHDVKLETSNLNDINEQPYLLFYRKIPQNTEAKSDNADVPALASSV